MADDSEFSGAFCLLDSGVSCHFTGDIGDFASYNVLKRAHYAKMANGVVLIAGIGMVLLWCLDHNSGDEKVTTLTQVLHMPGATACLISMGEMLQCNYKVTGDKRGISLTHKAEHLWFGPDPEDDCNVIFGIRSIPIIRSNYIASVSKVDYDIMHWRFRHPSKEVLQCAQKHMQQFPEIHFPTEDCVCPGCALGKMPNWAFPENKRRASKPFELVHSDLKSFPVTSYWKFKYVITFYNDFTSHTWTMPLHSKAAAITAAKDFLEMVRVQHNAHVVGWMSNAGGEYKADLFDWALLEKGIKIYQSAPRTPMQNGHTEWLGCTLMDKAKSMRHQACIRDSWWVFAFAHATHIYNRTPVACLRWHTPHEMLKGELPNIDHLRVFGCGAFVYLPATARANKMAPKLELMTYVGVAPGNERNFLFICSTNAVFTAAHAVFDECHFPCCPKNWREPLENPFGRVNPKPTTDWPGNPPDDIDSNDDVEHDHGYPHPQVQDDNPKHKEPQAPEEEPNQINPPRTPSPVPPLAPRMSSPVRNPPPLAPQHPGQAECHQNVPQPPAANIPACPQREHRVPLHPSNVYGERWHPVEKLRDIESASRWCETVGEASRPPQLDTPDHVPGGFPDTSATPSEEDVQKMCEEGGANLVQFLMGKALTTHEPQYESVCNWSYKDIAHLPQAEQKLWQLACQEELNVLRKCKVFELVDRPQDRKVIKNQWVFNVKLDGCKKARLVAKGFSQVEGLDFNQVFSPVVRFETVRLMLALAALENWYITGLDIQSAYLYGKLDKEIYMEQPKGFAVPRQEHKVLCLWCALYGLAWWRTLNESLKELGFECLKSEAGIFFYKKKGTNIVIGIIYIDDALFCGPNKAVVDVIKVQFMCKWEFRDLGEPNEFLRMQITCKGCTIHLDQCMYLQKVIERCGMLNAKSASTPLLAGYYATKNTEPVDADLHSCFRTVIGSLLYLMLGIRPNIAFAVTHLLRHATNPSQDHLNKVLYICFYLIGTSTYSLVYIGGSGAGLIACMDSDWGSDPTSHLSQTGFYLKLADGLISWTSRAQKTIVYSSTEAEYMALSDCARQVTWIWSLLGELSYKLKAILICGDNQGSIFMASNPVMEPRSKHIDICYHRIRESVVKGNVELFFIDGAENPADLLTKNLPRKKFTKFRAQLGLQFPSGSI